MPLRPVSSRLSIGIDVTSIARFARHVTGHKHDSGVNTSFLAKLMTRRERDLFWHRFARDAWRSDTGSGACARYLAGRWAAKEAVIKAHAPSRTLFMHDIEIHAYKSHPAPFAIVLDRRLNKAAATPDSEMADSADEYLSSSTRTQVAEVSDLITESTQASSEPVFRPHEIDGQVVSISISHDGDVVTACALAALGDPGNGVEGDVGGEALARGSLGWSPWQG